MIRSCLPIACLLTLFVVSDANAQRRIPNYTRGNTLSPYINMFRGNTGGINNYFSLVRPMQAQSRFNQMQMTQDRRLQQQLIMNQSNFPFGPYAVGQQGSRMAIETIVFARSQRWENYRLTDPAKWLIYVYRPLTLRAPIGCYVDLCESFPA